MQRKLSDQYGGRRAATGLRDPGQIMEVPTDTRGDWTLAMRYAHGV